MSATGVCSAFAGHTIRVQVTVEHLLPKLQVGTSPALDEVPRSMCEDQAPAIMALGTELRAGAGDIPRSFRCRVHPISASKGVSRSDATAPNRLGVCVFTFKGG